MRLSLSRRDFVALAGASAMVLAGCSSDDSETAAGSAEVEEEAEAEEEEAADTEVEAEEEEADYSDFISLELVETGYFMEEDGDIHSGIGLYNPNETYAVSSPDVQIVGRAEDGTILFADEPSLCSIILPGQTMYFGRASYNDSDTDVPVTVEYSVLDPDEYQIEETDEQAEEHYAFSNTSMQTSSTGRVSFTGEVTTVLAEEDEPSNIELDVIMRDESGAIVYGFNESIDVPGEAETMAFEVDARSDVPDFSTYEFYTVTW